MTNWDESQHPRHDDGKFAYKNGGNSSSSSTDREREKLQNRADILFPNTVEKKEKNNSISNNDISLGNYDNSQKIPLLKGYISYDNYPASKQNFITSMDVVFKNEGGFSDNPDDKGGRTNMGITQSTYNDYCKRHKLEAKDVKKLTKKEAVEVYYNDYWKASGADKIKNPVEALILFDTAVLHGTGKAKQFYRQSNGNFNKILELRKEHYINKVKSDPSQKKFFNGWNNRVDNLEKMLKNSEKD